MRSACLLACLATIDIGNRGQLKGANCPIPIFAALSQAVDGDEARKADVVVSGIFIFYFSLALY